jgi:hypothetical protein
MKLGKPGLQHHPGPILLSTSLSQQNLMEERKPTKGKEEKKRKRNFKFAKRP